MRWLFLRLIGSSAVTSGSKDPVLDTAAKRLLLIRRLISESRILSIETHTALSYQTKIN